MCCFASHRLASLFSVCANTQRGVALHSCQTCVEAAGRPSPSESAPPAGRPRRLGARRASVSLPSGCGAAAGAPAECRAADGDGGGCVRDRGGPAPGRRAGETCVPAGARPGLLLQGGSLIQGHDATTPSSVCCLVKLMLREPSSLVEESR